MSYAVCDRRFSLSALLLLGTWVSVGCGPTSLTQDAHVLESFIEPQGSDTLLETPLAPSPLSPLTLTSQTRSTRTVSLRSSADLDTTQDLTAVVVETQPSYTVETLSIAPESPQELVVTFTENLLPQELTITLRGLKLARAEAVNVEHRLYPQTRVAFLSRSKGSANLSSWDLAGGKTGVAAADEICQREALEAGYPGRFAAWISSSTRHAREAFEGSEGAWVTPADGRPVFAASFEELVSGTTRAPLHTQANGQAGSNPNGHTLLTRSSPNGFRSGGSFKNYYCQDWSDDVSSSTINDVGNSLAVGAQWSGQRVGVCKSRNFRLACMQVDSGAPAP